MPASEPSVERVRTVVRGPPTGIRTMPVLGLQKELRMTTRENGTCRELFESASDIGTRFVFVIMADDGWAITRDRQRIAVGTADPGSIHAGVDQFETLTHLAASGLPCDPGGSNVPGPHREPDPALQEQQGPAAPRQVRTVGR